MLNMIASIMLGIAVVFNLFNGDAEWVVIDSLLLAFNLPPAILWCNRTMK